MALSLERPFIAVGTEGCHMPSPSTLTCIARLSNRHRVPPRGTKTAEARERRSRPTTTQTTDDCILQ
jgi:hypothetical protein